MSKARGLADLGNVYSDGALSNRSKIINGAMVIDQRNAGASVAVSGSGSAYSTDRWSGFNSSDGAFTLQQVTDAPTGFTHSLKFTTTTADASLGSTQHVGLRQMIEGYNVSDLAFGSSDAKTVTVSFWVKSSLTGAFGGALLNAAENRSFPFSCTINSADTWEYKTVTITGDTTGSWSTGNSTGFRLTFGLGVGSSYSGTAGAWTSSAYTYSVTGAVSVIGTLNATWQITGVQLEVGDTATPFEHPRSYSDELSRCQRYFYSAADGTAQALGMGVYYTTTQMFGAITFPVTMRATPTLAAASGSQYYEFIRDGGADYFNSLSLGNRTTNKIGEIQNDSEVDGTGRIGYGGWIRTDNSSVYVHFDAEL